MGPGREGFVEHTDTGRRLELTYEDPDTAKKARERCCEPTRAVLTYSRAAPPVSGSTTRPRPREPASTNRVVDDVQARSSWRSGGTADATSNPATPAHRAQVNGSFTQACPSASANVWT